MSNKKIRKSGVRRIIQVFVLLILQAVIFFVSAGHYKIVRHPGYVGMILLNLSTPLIIGSVFALIPAVIICILFITRTSLEDKMLYNELKGYAKYSKQTKYRLFPGIW